MLKVKPENKKTILLWGTGLILFFGVNTILYGAQELYWHKDTVEINKIEDYLETEKAEISPLELEIENQSIELGSKKNGMKYTKILGESDGYYLYNKKVDEYNELLDIYNSNIDLYQNKLSEYNNKVDTVNELIKKSGSRWYLIPIPLTSSSLKSKL